MAIEKRTLVDQIEITRQGVIQLRIRAELVEDGDVINYAYHRHTLTPGDDAVTAKAILDNNLRDLKHLTVTPQDWQRVAKVAVAVWTPEVIEAAQERLRQAQEETNPINL